MRENYIELSPYTSFLYQFCWLVSSPGLSTHCILLDLLLAIDKRKIGLLFLADGVKTLLLLVNKLIPQKLVT